MPQETAQCHNGNLNPKKTEIHHAVCWSCEILEPWRTLRWQQEKLRAFCEYENLLGEKLMAAISEELIEKMVRGRGAGRRSPEESLKLLIQLRRAFPQLGMAEVPRFLKVGENKEYYKGDLLTTQGERNEYLWLLLSGTLNVIVDSQMVAQLSEGALIGEACLSCFCNQTKTRKEIR